MFAIKRSRFVKMDIEEEYELIRKAKSGDQKAIDVLVSNNEGLIHKYLRKYKVMGTLEYDDLFQSGVIGLIHSFEKFDLKSGNRLSTYATLWIKATVTREMIYHDQVMNLPADYPQKVKADPSFRISSDSMDNVINDHGDSFTEYFADDESLDWELQIESTDRMDMLLECLEWIDEMPRKLIMEIIIKGRPVKDVCAELGMRADTQRDLLVSGLEELKVPLRKLYGINGLKECLQ